MDGQHDKVDVKNYFKPAGGGEGGMGGLGTAAVIAAMGNRNEGATAGALPAIMAATLGRPHGDGFGMGGFGAGLVGGLLGGALFGGRRGGLFGGGDGDGNGGAETRIDTNILSTAILGKLGTIEGAIPLAAAGTENTILQQTIGINGSLGSLALGTQQGFSNVKDSVQANSALNLVATGGVKDTVQNATAILLQNLCDVKASVLATGCSIERVVNNDGDRTRALINAINDAAQNRLIATQAAEIIELRNEGRRSHDNGELRLQITNQATAVAAQAQGQQQQQQQQQFSLIQSLFPLLNGVLQVAHATNSNVIAGNTAAVVTGPQTANPTNVNA